MGDIARTERTNTGETPEHRFYGRLGVNYVPADDRAPLLRSLFRAADKP